MSDSAKRAFGSSAKPKRKEANLTLMAARSMLPLVKSIVQELVVTHDRLSRLHPEQDRLERHRIELAWQERNRRYQVEDEIKATQKAHKEAMNELNKLGLEVVDEDHGRVAFPTKVNGRPAKYFWQPGDESVQFWSYAEEEVVRPIPADWSGESTLRVKGKA